MEDQFLSKLYQIKAFKVVESPESLKKHPHSMIEEQPRLEYSKKLSDNEAERSHKKNMSTPNKENQQ